MNTRGLFEFKRKLPGLEIEASRSQWADRLVIEVLPIRPWGILMSAITLHIHVGDGKLFHPDQGADHRHEFRVFGLGFTWHQHSAIRSWMVSFGFKNDLEFTFSSKRSAKMWKLDRRTWDTMPRSAIEARAGVEVSALQGPIYWRWRKPYADGRRPSPAFRLRCGWDESEGFNAFGFHNIRRLFSFRERTPAAT